jgi:hypothetical protein
MGLENQVKRKQPVFDQEKEVRAIARERVGPVKASRPILPKDQRKKPKHKKPPGDE